MGKEKRFRSLREWVDAQPRRVRQRDLAAELGISDSFLSNCLSRNRGMSLKMAQRVSAKTGIAVVDLLARSATEAQP